MEETPLKRQGGLFTTAIGLCSSRQLRFVSDSDLSTTKALLLQSVGQTSGRGLRAGRIVVRAANNHLKIVLQTTYGRSGSSPMLDGVLLNRPDGKTVLQGRFRWSYPMFFVTLAVQAGLLVECVAFLAAARYRKLGLTLLEAWISVVVGALAVFLIPHVAWITRKWKMYAIVEYVKLHGLSESRPAPELHSGCSHTLASEDREPRS